MHNNNSRYNDNLYKMESNDEYIENDHNPMYATVDAIIDKPELKCENNKNEPSNETDKFDHLYATVDKK